MSRLVLAGDLGGTKANLALFEMAGSRLEPVRDATLRCAAYPSVPALVRAFLGDSPPTVAAACFGVAGPVRAGRVAMTNLPWTVDAREVERSLGLPRVSVVNDLVATARGIEELPIESFAVLQEGRSDPEGNAALIAAGTGLGEAVLFRRGASFVPSPSEGGHASFAPRTDLEIELLRFLRAELGRVSVERVASGPGLRDVYRFLTGTGRAAESPEVRNRLEREDPSAVIAEEALQGADPACAAALDLWTAAFGAEAGDLALKVLATAGVYVGGGVAPKVLAKLREGGFLAAFRNKGRFSDLLADVPVRVILDPKAALHGAARYAVEAAARR